MGMTNWHGSGVGEYEMYLYLGCWRCDYAVEQEIHVDDWGRAEYTCPKCDAENTFDVKDYRDEMKVEGL